MGKCSICGTGLAFLEGYNNEGKRYCSNCWNNGKPKDKKEKPSELKKDEKGDSKKKLKENSKNNNLWVWLFIIAAIISFSYWNPFSNNNDYEYCVDSCVSENDFCLSMNIEVASNFVEYILSEDMEDCQWDLEDCVEDCKK